MIASCISGPNTSTIASSRSYCDIIIQRASPYRPGQRGFDFLRTVIDVNPNQRPLAAHCIDFCQTGEDPRPKSDCMGPPLAAPVNQKQPLPLTVQDAPRTRTIGVGAYTHPKPRKTAYEGSKAVRGSKFNDLVYSLRILFGRNRKSRPMSHSGGCNGGEDSQKMKW